MTHCYRIERLTAGALGQEPCCPARRAQLTHARQRGEVS